jgi:hypothetical protein
MRLTLGFGENGKTAKKSIIEGLTALSGIMGDLTTPGAKGSIAQLIKVIDVGSLSVLNPKSYSIFIHTSANGSQ